MGVAVCYAAPVGGVLFSIEVTTAYFAVRNYWKGFFASVVGALFYRLLGVWCLGDDTIYPLFQVTYNFVYPYDVSELLMYLIVSIVASFMGAGFVYCHRRYVLFMRVNHAIKRGLTKWRFLYPLIVSVFVSAVVFPDALGRYMASDLSARQQVLQLMSNVTWGSYGENPPPQTLEQEEILSHWTDQYNGNFFISLFVFQIVTVIQIIVCSTLPVPSGLLIPLLKVGAAFGRAVGEGVVSMYPARMFNLPIVPGSYAMVGAASFCAAITHTISISVILFELTGQMDYAMPVLIGTLTANCISSLLQPSIYDSVIRIKKLPYLPDIPAVSSSQMYTTSVEDIMVKDLAFISYDLTYKAIREILRTNRRIKFFPLVDSEEHMILLGSVRRVELVTAVVSRISPAKRREEAQKRRQRAIRRHFQFPESILALDPTSTNSSHSNSLEYSNTLTITKNTPLGGLPRNGSLEFPADPQYTVHSTTVTSTAKYREPAKTDVRDLFKVNSDVESKTHEEVSRKDSRFSVSKVGGTESSVTDANPEVTVEDLPDDEDVPAKNLKNKLVERVAVTLNEHDTVDMDNQTFLRAGSLVRSNSLDSIRSIRRKSV